MMDKRGLTLLGTLGTVVIVGVLMVVMLECCIQSIELFGKELSNAGKACGGPAGNGVCKETCDEGYVTTEVTGGECREEKLNCCIPQTEKAKKEAQYTQSFSEMIQLLISCKNNEGEQGLCEEATQKTLNLMTEDTNLVIEFTKQGDNSIARIQFYRTNSEIIHSKVIPLDMCGGRDGIIEIFHSKNDGDVEDIHVNKGWLSGQDDSFSNFEYDEGSICINTA